MNSRHDDFAELMRQERARQRRAVARFVEVVERGDADGLHESLDELYQSFGNMSAGFRALRRTAGAPPGMRKAFLKLSQSDGDDLRSDCEDPALLDGLRLLLPAYTGGPRRLYRGDSLFNRERRTYGISWSSARTVADIFARERSSRYQRGTVLLETIAPVEAIICRVPSDGYREAEFVVDRRKLGQIREIARYPSIAESGG